MSARDAEGDQGRNPTGNPARNPGGPSADGRYLDAGPGQGPGPGPGRGARAGREHAEWTRSPLGGDQSLDLLTARFDRHRYAPHSHDEFTVGVCVSGSGAIDYRGGTLHVGPGSIIVLGPGEMHTGGAGPDGGYAYRAMYPAPSLLAEGTASLPNFREPILDDPELAAALRAAHTDLSGGMRTGVGTGTATGAGTGTDARTTDTDGLLAAAAQDPLEAESRLPWLLAALARRHGTARPVCDLVPGADRIARVVRDRLADELLAPPSLAELAASLGLSRYQVLRSFRDTMGLPPYAWLAQHRVARARGLLEAGYRPADAAGLVGFADQAHLTRWFRRVLGVTPAAYRASVLRGGRTTLAPRCAQA